MPNWRGKIPVPANTHPLVKRFIRECNEQQTTINEVASRAGVHRGTVSDWRYRFNPSLPIFEAALNVLDLELCIRRRKA